MKKIILDKTEVTQDSLPYVIAEIGHNHQGSVEKCKELFRKAKFSGANAVKLQKRDNKKLIPKNFLIANITVKIVMEKLTVSTEKN